MYGSKERTGAATKSDPFSSPLVSAFKQSNKEDKFELKTKSGSELKERKIFVPGLEARMLELLSAVNIKGGGGLRKGWL